MPVTLDIDSLPRWDEVIADPRFKNGSEADRLQAVQNYRALLQPHAVALGTGEGIPEPDIVKKWDGWEQQQCNWISPSVGIPQNIVGTMANALAAGVREPVAGALRAGGYLGVIPHGKELADWEADPSKVVGPTWPGPASGEIKVDPSFAANPIVQNAAGIIKGLPALGLGVATGGTGGLAALGAANLGLSYQSIYEAAKEKALAKEGADPLKADDEANKAALVGALPSAVLQTTIDRLLPGMGHVPIDKALEMPGIRNMLGRAMKAAAQGAGVGAAIGAGSQAIQNVAIKSQVDSNQSVTEGLLEAGVGGVAGGGVLGLGMHALAEGVKTLAAKKRAADPSLGETTAQKAALDEVVTPEKKPAVVEAIRQQAVTQTLQEAADALKATNQLDAARVVANEALAAAKQPVVPVPPKPLEPVKTSDGKAVSSEHQAIAEHILQLTQVQQEAEATAKEDAQTTLDSRRQRILDHARGNPELLAQSGLAEHHDALHQTVSQDLAKLDPGEHNAYLHGIESRLGMHEAARAEAPHDSGNPMTDAAVEHVRSQHADTVPEHPATPEPVKPSGPGTPAAERLIQHKEEAAKVSAEPTGAVEAPKTFNDYFQNKDAEGLRAAIESGKDVRYEPADVAQSGAILFVRGKFDLKGGKIGVKPDFASVKPEAGFAQTSDILPALHPKYHPEYAALPPHPNEEALIKDALTKLNSVSGNTDQRLAKFRGVSDIGAEDVNAAVLKKATDQLRSKPTLEKLHLMGPGGLYEHTLNDAVRKLEVRLKHFGKPALDIADPNVEALAERDHPEHGISPERGSNAAMAHGGFDNLPKLREDFKATLTDPQEHKEFDRLWKREIDPTDDTIKATKGGNDKLYQDVRSRFFEYAKPRAGAGPIRAEQPPVPVAKRPPVADAGRTGTAKSEADAGRTGESGAVPSADAPGADRSQPVAPGTGANDAAGQAPFGAAELGGAPVRPAPGDAGGQPGQPSATPSGVSKKRNASAPVGAVEVSGTTARRSVPAAERSAPKNRKVASANPKPGFNSDENWPGGKSAEAKQQRAVIDKYDLRHGRAIDVLAAIQEHGGPENSALAEKMQSVHEGRLNGVTIHQVEGDSDSLYHHDGKIYATAKALMHPEFEEQMTRELSDTLSSDLLRTPKEAREERLKLQFQGLVDRAMNTLPDDIRASVRSKMEPIIQEFDRTGKLRTESLSKEEQKYFPVAYAFRSPEALAHGFHSYDAVRSYLEGKGLGNRTRELIGDLHQSSSEEMEHLWHVADSAKDRPGIHATENPQIPSVNQWDRIDQGFGDAVSSLPIVAKYRLNEGVKAAIDRVAELDNDPQQKAAAEFLQAAFKNSSDLKISFESLPNAKGEFSLTSDTVRINPAYAREPLLQRTLLHEAMHALSSAKIQAYALGRFDLLKPHEISAAHGISQLRESALRHAPDSAQELAEIAKLPNRNELMRQFASQGGVDEKYYGLANDQEFVSEAITNGEFQKFLHSLPSQGAEGKPLSHLQRFWQQIVKLFGGNQASSLSDALMHITSLTEGRRLMRSDYEVDGMKGYGNKLQEEGKGDVTRLMAQLKELGVKDPHDVEPERLNEEYRKAQGGRPNTWDDVPHTVEPDLTSPIRETAGLSALEHPVNILEHLAQVRALDGDDLEALGHAVEKGFNDGALKPEQYLAARNALDSASVPLPYFLTPRSNKPRLGDPADEFSLVRKLEKWGNYFKAGGGIEPSIRAAQGNRAGFERLHANRVRNATFDLNEAIKKEFKVKTKADLPASTIEEMNDVLQGPQGAYGPFAWSGKAPETMQALKQVRFHMDKASDYLLNEGKLNQRLNATISQNLGSYVKKSYQIFKDPAWLNRTLPQGDLDPKLQSAAAVLMDQNRREWADQYAKTRTDWNRPAGTTLNDWQRGKAAFDAEYQQQYQNGLIKAARNITLTQTRQDLYDHLQRLVKRPDAMAMLRAGEGAARLDADMLIRRKDLPQEYKDLLGEIKDPFLNYRDTIDKTIDYTANRRMLEEIHAAGKAEGWLQDHATKLHSTEIAAEGSKTLGPLAGLHTTPEIAAVLKGLNGIPVNHDSAWTAARRLNAQVKLFTTVHSARGIVQNALGQIFLPMMNGHLSSVEDWKMAGKVALHEIRTSKDPNTRDAANRVVELGLGGDNVDFGLVHQILRETAKTGESTDLFEEVLRGAGDNPIKKAYGWTFGGASRVFSAVDTAGRLLYYGPEVRLLTKAYDGVNGPRKSREEIEHLAAANVLRSSMTAHNLSPFDRAMRQQPVIGPFAGYFSQVIHAIHGSTQLMAEQWKSNNPVLKAHAAKRLAGMAGTLTLPFLVQHITQAFTGVSNDQDEALRKMLPDYEKNSALWYVHNADGKLLYGNYSYASPYTYVTDFLLDFVRQLHENHGVMKVPNALVSSGGTVLRNLTDLGLVARPVLESMTNLTAYGTPIANPNDTPIQQVGEKVGHVGQAMVGGTLGRLVKRIIPAALGAPMPGGETTSALEQVIGEVSGSKLKEVNYQTLFQNSLRDAKDDLHETETGFVGPLQRDGNHLDDNQIRTLYNQAEDRRRQLYQDLHEKASAALLSGVPRKVVMDALSHHVKGSTAVSDVLAGRYRAYRPSSQVIQNARKVGNRLPPNLIPSGAQPLE